MVGNMMTIDQSATGNQLSNGGAQQYLAVRCCAIFALLFSSLACAADTLQDPTRPPAVLSMPQGGAESLSPTGPQLQSVRISTHQRSAIISGQRVKVGDRFGDTKVVMITENEVVLKGSSGMQTLKLFPDVGKRIIMRRQHPEH
jgi:MSHA biogenesis protein MshK